MGHAVGSVVPPLVIAAVTVVVMGRLTEDSGGKLQLIPRLPLPPCRDAAWAARDTRRNALKVELDKAKAQARRIATVFYEPKDKKDGFHSPTVEEDLDIADATVIGLQRELAKLDAQAPATRPGWTWLGGGEGSTPFAADPRMPQQPARQGSPAERASIRR